MTSRGDFSNRTQWYAKRLRSMPLAEIPYRMREAARRYADRRGKFAARYAHAPEALRRLSAPSFPLALDALRGATEGDRVRIAGQARDILGDRLVLLGQRWPVGARTDWALDPVSGSHWEWDRLCFDIDRRLGRGPGDVKLTWELSRLQHLQVLALDAFLSGSVTARNACVDDLAAWMAGNPPFRGLGYACGIELSSRIISVFVVVALLGPESLSPELTAAIWDMINAHAAWLARYQSLYSSANNHLMAEAGGLFAIGSLAPELPEAETWRTIGREHLEHEAARQITADGVGAEQSPTYQAYVMEWLLIARRIAAVTGQQLDSVIDHRLNAGARFLATILDAGGNHPRFGDDDEGTVLRQDLGRERLPLAIAGTIGALFGTGSSCHPEYYLDLRARMLGASSLPANNWRPVSTTFPQGGYTVLRAGQVMALFDHGPLGYSYTAGHGHADTLAVWLHVGGTPLLVDAGTFRYNYDAGWREHMRGTAAHNTIIIDGLDQSEQTGPFNWGRRARGHLISADLEGTPTATASHDGYALLGINHERAVSIDENTFLLKDRVLGSGRHYIRLTLQFAPGFEVKTAGEGRWRVTSEHGPTALVDVTRSLLAAHVEEQTLVPGPGAVSPRYNELIAAPALLLEGEVSLPFEVVTIITITTVEQAADGRG
jgi:hypothetical protein